MKKFLTIILLFCIIMNLCACSSIDKTDKIERKETQVQEQVNDDVEFYITNAEKELKKYLEYFEEDFSGIENKGVQEISDCRYVVFEAIGYDGFSYYVDIDENYDIYSGFPNSGMDLIWTNGAPARIPAEVEDFDDTPLVAYMLDVIGDSFQAYKNKFGGLFLDISNNNNYMQAVAMNIIDGVSYYYNGDNSSTVAVKDDMVVAFAYSPRNFYDSSSSLSVRDAINAEKLSGFFDVQPKILPVDDATFLYSWKTLNGYYGVIANHYNKENIYGNHAWFVVLYADKEYCSAYNDN